jgi:hypothetical protein
MSSENRFLNFHMKKDCLNNSKIGFQSLDSEVQALQKGLGYVRDKLIAKGLLKDSETMVIYARYTETNAAEELEMDEVQFADGTTREVPSADTEAEAETDEIPF